MMTMQMDAKGKHWLVSLLQTLVLCLFIAVVIELFNGAGLWLNYWFALGYGLPILLASFLLACYPLRISESMQVVLCLLAGLLLGSINLYLVLYSPWFGTPVSNLDSLPTNLAMSAAFSVIGFYFFYSRYRLHEMKALLSEQARDKAEQERALAQSQLQNLQNQMEPHFLFNTLANIQVLIEHQPKDARAMLSALTQLLRANLHQVRQSQTTLAEEISLLNSYLAIQQIRMGDRLQYDLHVQPGLESVMLPPLLLQPLVENALKHGLEPKTEGGQLRVRVFSDQQFVWLRVADNGLGSAAISTTRGQGVALANIEQRLASLYRGEARLQLAASADGFVADIILPRSLALKEAQP